MDESEMISTGRSRRRLVECLISFEAITQQLAGLRRKVFNISRRAPSWD